MRYEIKYTFPPAYSAENAVRSVLSLPGLFREIYSERRVNNIYLDTPEMADYSDAVNGVSERSKTRIRWYGELMQAVQTPILEVKEKRGMLGNKVSVPLAAFLFGPDFDYGRYYKDLFKRPDGAEKQKILAVLGNRFPSLVNSYKRRYFAVPDDSVRITIDRELCYYDPKTVMYGEYGMPPDRRIILEAKFDVEDAYKAMDLLQPLGLHTAKNSKYVSGINHILYGAAIAVRM
jgi:hypothetical protein